MSEDTRDMSEQIEELRTSSALPALTDEQRAANLAAVEAEGAAIAPRRHVIHAEILIAPLGTPFHEVEKWKVVTAQGIERIRSVIKDVVTQGFGTYTATGESPGEVVQFLLATRDFLNGETIAYLGRQNQARNVPRSGEGENKAIQSARARSARKAAKVARRKNRGK